jgi:hypothetical protein
MPSPEDRLDKSRFIERAPLYYALAVAAHFDSNSGRSGSISSIEGAYTVQEDDADPYCYVSKSVLLIRGIDWLIEKGLVAAEPDDFGPTTYHRTSNFYSEWSSLKDLAGTPFHKFAQSPDGERWIYDALLAVNRQSNQLEIKDRDFDKPDDEWEPLPLDRDDQNLKEAIKAVEDTIEAVRSDNGYAQTVPEERKYVLDSLNSAARTLKESDTVSVPYLKTYALEPLSRVIRRFGKAAAGATASLTKDAIYTWLKSGAVKGLELLFKMIFS